MKFAVVSGQRQVAQPGLAALCPGCEQPVIAKCGTVKIWHWAHRGKRSCDPWWENETEWHRAWKGQFPTDWQEVVQFAGSGEKHIADIKTSRGWVIEFQHSYLNPDERRAREAFYQDLVWVVDGTRLKKGAEKFFETVREGSLIANSAYVRRISSDGCRLIRDWADGRAPVLFDFCDGGDLWWLAFGRQGGPPYVLPLPRSDFINIHRDGIPQDFNKLAKTVSALLANHEALKLAIVSNRAARGFQNDPLAPSRRRRF
jgi:hypothetical protein